MNMGRVQAVIYLSNDLTYGAFTENRVALLEVLASQMATSIENAVFYNELENKVEERIIKTGIVTAEKAQVVEGLLAGERVVLSGQLNLENGAAVTVNQ